MVLQRDSYTAFHIILADVLGGGGGRGKLECLGEWGEGIFPPPQQIEPCQHPIIPCFSLFHDLHNNSQKPSEGPKEKDFREVRSSRATKTVDTGYAGLKLTNKYSSLSNN